MILRVVGLLCMLVSGLVLSQAAAQDSSEGASATYYLHMTGTCESEFERFLDHEDSAGDLENCATFGPGGAVGGFVAEFPAKSLLGIRLEPGDTATAHIFVQTRNPDMVSVGIVFSAGGASCSATSEEKQVTNTPATADYAEFSIPCEVGGAANESAEATLEVTTHASVLYILGFEEDYASRIDLQGHQPAVANATNATDPTQPGGGSPAASAALVLVSVVVAATILASRRR